jgi:hypothetical protein
MAMEGLKGKFFNESRVEILLLVVFLLFGLLRVMNHVTLNFDGSFFFLQNFFAQGLANDEDYSRLMGHILYEAPNLFYLRFFKPDLRVSFYLYSFTAVFLPILLLLIHRIMLRGQSLTHFYYHLLSYTFLLSSSLYYDSNEMHLANGFLWLFLTLYDQRQESSGKGRFFVLIFLMLAVTFCYPLFLVVIPLLILESILSKTQTIRVGLWSSFGLIFLLNIAFTIHHQSLMPGTGEEMINGLSHCWGTPTIPALVVIYLFFFLSSLIPNQKQFISIVGVGLGFFVYYHYRHEFYIWQLKSGRVWGVLFLLGLMVLSRIKKVFLSYQVLPAIILGCMAINSLNLSWWINYEKTFLHKLDGLYGEIERDKFTNIYPEFDHAATHWNAEIYSLMIQHLHHLPIQAIIRSDPSYPLTFYPGETNEEREERIKDFLSLGVVFDQKFLDAVRVNNDK